MAMLVSYDQDEGHDKENSKTKENLKVFSHGHAAEAPLTVRKTLKEPYYVKKMKERDEETRERVVMHSKKIGEYDCRPRSRD
mmetsp:Transcript_20844/g.47306  ORF Transcript_20844/g.47306 Transcript_20844/m.47306 type:complete len:82 (-) Transcript_20844:1700-1945(-)